MNSSEHHDRILTSNCREEIFFEVGEITRIAVSICLKQQQHHPRWQPWGSRRMWNSSYFCLCLFRRYGLFQKNELLCQLFVCSSSSYFRALLGLLKVSCLFSVMVRSKFRRVRPGTTEIWEMETFHICGIDLWLGKHRA